MMNPGYYYDSHIMQYLIAESFGRFLSLKRNPVLRMPYNRWKAKILEKPMIFKRVFPLFYMDVYMAFFQKFVSGVFVKL